MGGYELDQENYLHCTSDGWITTTRPLTQEEIKQLKSGTLDMSQFDWE